MRGERFYHCDIPAPLTLRMALNHSHNHNRNNNNNILSLYFLLYKNIIDKFKYQWRSKSLRPNIANDCNFLE